MLSRPTGILTRTRSFAHDTGGSVLIMGAIALPVLVGVVALVAEFGHALLTRTEHQRVADLASFAGATAYGRASSTADMNAAAFNVALLNGIEPGSVSVELVPSPRAAEKQAVSVTVSSKKQLLLAQVLGSRAGLDIAALAIAEVGSQESEKGCILALSPNGTGVTLSGGTNISAPECSVSSNATVTVPCGTNITAKTVHYNSAAAPHQPCNGIQKPGGGPAEIVKTSTPDPLAGHAGVLAATARMADVAALSGPAAPAVAAGQDIDFAWNQNATKNAASAAGCTANFVQPLWTLDCAGQTTVNFGNMTVGGGISVAFNPGGSPNTVYNFSGRIQNSGANVQFAPGTYNVAQGIITGGGSTTSFGAGTFRVGRTQNNCSAHGGNARYSICNTSTLHFAGPSTFLLEGGFSNTGGSTLTFGQDTTTNSYRIGPSSNGNTMALGGGSTTIMGDALGQDSVFELAGHVNGSGGNSCLAIPAATNHDIKGNFIGGGSVIFGAGTYTIDGYVDFGSSGGATMCNGVSVTLRGIGVTFVVSAKQTPNSWNCGGRAFCVGAGYSNMALTAPETGPMAQLAMIGPQNNSAGALFDGGASGSQIAGAFYFPNGPFNMAGGASASGFAAERCLQIVASQITLTGGTSAVSECIGSAAGSEESKVTLVQ